MKLVFLHGLLGAPGMWHRVEAALARVATGYEAYALLLPGHTTAPWLLDAPAHYVAFDDVVDALATRLPPTAAGEPLCLVGYSLGARLALGLCARHPERIARAVLVGVHPGFRDEAARTARVAFDEGLAAQLEKDGLEAFCDSWEKLPVFASQATLPPDLRAARRSERLAHEPAALAWAMRALTLGRMPARDDLAALAPTIHLVTGALDEKFTAVNALLARTAPQRTTHCIVEGAGHDLALEAPAALASIIKQLCDLPRARTAPPSFTPAFRDEKPQEDTETAS